MTPLTPIIGDVIGVIGQVADDLFTSDEERAKLALEDRRIDLEQNKAQMAVNAAEATSASVFVAGWRPAIGWVGAAAMAYQFLLYPGLVWAWSLLQAAGWVSMTLTAPPMLDTDALWVILSGMLGIAGMRTAEKIKGVAQ
jgi:hypothetical protein